MPLKSGIQCVKDRSPDQNGTEKEEKGFRFSGKLTARTRRGTEDKKKSTKASMGSPPELHKKKKMKERKQARGKKKGKTEKSSFFRRRRKDTGGNYDLSDMRPHDGKSRTGGTSHREKVCRIARGSATGPLRKRKEPAIRKHAVFRHPRPRYSEPWDKTPRIPYKGGTSGGGPATKLPTPERSRGNEQKEGRAIKNRAQDG